MTEKVATQYRSFGIGIFLFSVLLSHVASADAVMKRSRLLATGGATTIEGAAGGGIVPMAVISGYGAQDEWAATAFASQVSTDDYNLRVAGASISLRNRIEISIAQQELEHRPLSRALGVADDQIQQTIIGVKVRITGDLIYTAIPQLSAGIQYKKNHDFFIPAAAGAVDDSGYDLYFSASKLILDGAFHRNWLLNGTLRHSKANQTGLVGFGGDKNNDATWLGEFSGGVFLNHQWLIGAEYRTKPDNLSFATEDDWETVFIAWFPNKRFSLVAGYVDLGAIASFEGQTGAYLSMQGSF
jgi:hypothetical protein